MDSLLSFPVGLFHPLVGSRTGAILRRCSLSVAPRFLWECLNSLTSSDKTGQVRLTFSFQFLFAFCRILAQFA
jgi:hypothetical protein